MIYDNTNVVRQYFYNKNMCTEKTLKGDVLIRHAFALKHWAEIKFPYDVKGFGTSITL